VQLLILTGQRRSEVAELTWREISFEERLWTLPAARAKNRIEHQIPLSDHAIEILRAVPKIAGSDFVFTISGRGPIHGHFSIKRRLDRLMPPDTPTWVLHDIRRSVASGMARLGINLPVIERILNHTGGTFAGIVGVYQRHSFADEKCTALTAWTCHIESIVTSEPAANIVTLKRG
jgi:integrase